MEQPTSIEPQPRIDTLVTDVATGAQRRRTEYSGTVWFGSRPQLTGFGAITRGGAARIDTAFFLPDSIPYRADAASVALITCSIALQSADSEGHQFIDRRASLVVDPRNPVVSWLQLQLLAMTRIPVAVSYRVDVIVPPDVAGPGDTPAG